MSFSLFTLYVSSATSVPMQCIRVCRHESMMATHPAKTCSSFVQSST